MRCFDPANLPDLRGRYLDLPRRDVINIKHRTRGSGVVLQIADARNTGARGPD